MHNSVVLSIIPTLGMNRVVDARALVRVGRSQHCHDRGHLQLLAALRAHLRARRSPQWRDRFQIVIAEKDSAGRALGMPLRHDAFLCAPNGGGCWRDTVRSFDDFRALSGPAREAAIAAHATPLDDGLEK
ncbi:Hypothetical protein UVM_LOCUS296 [uncultured virus]|nr:Hypothetical protein UVM_LOCUS296 [uncultured virus]